MLILSCKLGERIVLPGVGTVVSVVAIKGKIARLGISAPAQITVHRAEVWKQVDHETHSVAATDDQQEIGRHK